MNAPLAYMRASSISDFFDCAYRWYLVHLKKVQTVSSPRAWLGTSFHHGTAVFDQAKLDRNPVKIDDAVGAAVDLLQHPEEEVRWDADLPLREAEPKVIALTKMYCQVVAPTREYLSVERKCDELEVETDAGVLILTGHIDREKETKTGPGISDLKSGFRSVASDGTAMVKHHWIQTGVYRLLAGNGNPLPGNSEIIAASTGKVPKFGISEVGDDLTGLLGNGEEPGLLDTAARMIKAGSFPPNPRSMTCSEKYCPAWQSCIYKSK